VSQIELPATVRTKALQAGAEDWVGGLPELVAGLERDWGITVGRAFDAATEAYVAEAVSADGTPAVLKLLVPRPQLVADEITVLRLTSGSGCVRLLASAPGRHALLLERLGPSLFDLGVPFDRRLEIMCALAAQVWRPAPDCACARGRRRLDGSPSTSRPRGPISAGPARGRRSTTRSRAPSGGSPLTPRIGRWSARRCAPGEHAAHARRWLLPRRPGRAARRARVRPGGPHARGPARADGRRPAGPGAPAGARTGCDPVAIWEWGVVERASTGLVATSIGLQPVGAEMLAAADVVARSYASV
jgi:streptomycin 6-kinase